MKKILNEWRKYLAEAEPLKEGIGVAGRLADQHGAGTFTDKGVGSWKGDPDAVMNRLYVGKDLDTLQQALRQYQGKVEAQQRHKGTAAYDENAAKMVELLMAYIKEHYPSASVPEEGEKAVADVVTRPEAERLKGAVEDILGDKVGKQDPVEIMNRMYVGKADATLQQALELYRGKAMKQKPGDPNYDPIALKLYHLLNDYINKGTFRGMIGSGNSGEASGELPPGWYADNPGKWRPGDR